MKVGIVTPYLTHAGGGVFTAVQRLAQVLADRCSVRVFGLDDPSAAEDLATWAPLKAESFPIQGPNSFGYSPALRHALRSADSELIHSHGLWMYPSIAAHRSGKPCVISPHGMLDPWALALSRWKKKLAGAAFQNAHLQDASCLHALCRSEAESIRAYGLLNPICVIPNGIDLPTPSDAPASYEGKIPGDAHVLLYLGRLHPKKGLPALLRAWSAADPSWHLVIAGWDQAGHEAELQRLATDLRLERVHFAGPQFGPAKDAAYRRADAFILPSLSEGLPMVILEAWAHSKPVLMTNECNLPEGFTANAAHRIGSNPTEIANVLRDFTKLPAAELQAIGTRGRQLVERSFTWPTIAESFHAVYEWILGRTPHPPASVVQR